MATCLDEISLKTHIKYVYALGIIILVYDVYCVYYKETFVDVEIPTFNADSTEFTKKDQLDKLDSMQTSLNNMLTSYTQTVSQLMNVNNVKTSLKDMYAKTLSPF